MTDIMEAEEDWKKSTQREKAERKNVAGIVATKLAIKWNEREKLDEKTRSNFVQISLPCSQMQGQSLNNLIKKEIIKSFKWDKNDFIVTTSYSEKELNVVIDFIGI